LKNGSRGRRRRWCQPLKKEEWGAVSVVGGSDAITALLLPYPFVGGHQETSYALIHVHSLHIRKRKKELNEKMARGLIYWAT
jgi:hypothetical protein